MATFVRTQQIDHPIGAEGRLELRVTSADVRVRAVDGEDVRVRATFEIRAGTDAEADEAFAAAELQQERGSGVLRLAERREGSGLADAIGRIFGGNHHGPNDVEVELPAGAALRLETVSGDVQATGPQGDQDYRTVSGDLFLTDLGGGIRVNSVSGDATVRGKRSLEVRAEAVSGDLRVAAPTLRSVRASTVSGDIELEGELAAGGEFRTETVSGDLLVGLLGSAVFEVRGIATDISSAIDHRVEGRLDRRRVVIGSGGPTMVFNSMSGDLSVRRPRRLEAEAAPVPAEATPEERLAVLRALEHGEIDVDEAMRRIGGGTPDER